MIIFFFWVCFFFRHFVGVGDNGVGGNGDGGGVGVGGNGDGGGVGDAVGSGGDSVGGDDGGVSGVGVFGEGSSGSGGGGANGVGVYPISISINNSYMYVSYRSSKCGLQAKADFSPCVNNTHTTLTFIYWIDFKTWIGIEVAIGVLKQNKIVISWF